MFLCDRSRIIGAPLRIENIVDTQQNMRKNLSNKRKTGEARAAPV